MLSLWSRLSSRSGCDAVIDLTSLLDDTREQLAADRNPFAVAEDFFEAAVTPVSRLKAAPLNEADRRQIVAVVLLMLDCGRRLFAADREAARKLNEILRWARHLAGTLDQDAELAPLLETAHREWNWRLG